MPLREGDVLTLSRRAVLWLGQYDKLAPSVQLTRTLGAEPERDRQDMEATLYVELRRAVLFEIRDRRLDKHISADGYTTALIKHCEGVVRDGEGSKLARARAEWPKEGYVSVGRTGKSKGARKKKAPRRASR